MTLEYSVWIDGKTHRIRIEAPQPQSREEERLLGSVRSFAISTAYLEHLGYLPRGVTSVIA